MKKYLMIVCSITAVIIGSYLAYFHLGWYLPSFYNEGIQVKQNVLKDNSELIKGVEVISFIPGEHGTSYSISEEHYLQWFEDIQKMGANTIKARGIMNDDFYDAIDEYNRYHEDKLYLLQGIDTPEANTYDSIEEYFEIIKERTIDVIDVIHGRKNLLLGSVEKINRYRSDVSKWNIGYVLGSEWNPDIISFVDNSLLYDSSYKGQYVSLKSSASHFEKILAEIIDNMICYETNKYNSHSSIGMTINPRIDALHYMSNYARQIEKYTHVNVENIITHNEYKANLFIGLQLTDFYDDFVSYLTQEDQSLFDGIQVEEEFYKTYLQYWSKHSQLPVVISDYGVSEGIAKLTNEDVLYDEKAQGEQLMAIYEEAINQGLGGAVISSWQDNWERRSWNTAYATDENTSHLWQDEANQGTNYGILSFESGEDNAFVLDGKDQEWIKDYLVVDDDLKLYANYDFRGLNLLIKGKDLYKQKICIPIDTNDYIGSKDMFETKYSFSNSTDFVLMLENGKSRLMVNSQYDSTFFSFGNEIYGTNPYASHRYDNQFFDVSIAIDNKTVLEKLTTDNFDLIRMQTDHIGQLIQGNGDYRASNYSSIAKICYGQDMVEVSIPWYMLNVGDPAHMKIHDDYYKNYGVDFIKDNVFYLGITNKEQYIEMKSLELKSWKNDVEYVERKKQSYYIIQENWIAI